MAKESTKSREERAKSSTSPEELENLAQDKEVMVRRFVARNASTPVCLLEKLAEDKVGSVRSEVAENANTPVELLEKLAQDKEGMVRSFVARNANIPVPLLEKLAGDENEDVREAAARNESTPTSALEQKTVVDDKAKTILVESLKKTAGKIKKWTSMSGKPIRCFAFYSVWQNEEENGAFTVENNGESEEIEGYIMWGNKSSGTLIWELPASVDAAIETLGKDDWSDGEIEYDDKEGFEDADGKGSEAFDVNDNTIEGYDNFQGDGSTEVIGFGSIGGPSEITITYENQKEVVFESSGGGNWTVKIADGQPESIPDYEAALELVRALLK